jgi:hypothetical protein
MGKPAKDFPIFLCRTLFSSKSQSKKQKYAEKGNRSLCGTCGVEQNIGELPSTTFGKGLKILVYVGKQEGEGNSTQHPKKIEEVLLAEGNKTEHDGIQAKQNAQDREFGEMSHLTHGFFRDGLFNAYGSGDLIDDLMYLLALLGGGFSVLEGVSKDKAKPENGQKQTENDNDDTPNLRGI